MASATEESKIQSVTEMTTTLAAAAPRYEDALFVLQVHPKDGAIAPKVCSDVLTELMPSGSSPLVVGDARGGMSARQPSRVQLFTKSGISVALFSHTLAAETVADAFIKCRDRYLDDPRGRARALKDMLAGLHDAAHCFSLAAFDDSARAFVAWTPRSAPISFGHHVDGSVVVVGSLPRSRSLVGRQLNGDVQLAHLPAGRFLYGHGFLKPFEFTSMWSTATGNRAGARAATPMHAPGPASLPLAPLQLNQSQPVFGPAPPPTLSTVAVGGMDDLDKPKLSPEESSKWRWAKTGSRAEVLNTWKKKTSVAAPAVSTAVTSPPSADTSPTNPAVAASQIAAVAEAVAARTAVVVTVAVNALALAADKLAPASIDWAAWPRENPALAAAAVSLVAAAPKPTLAPAPATEVIVSAGDLAAAARQLLTFGTGALICTLMGADTNGGVGRINRFDTHPDKRFMTLLILRVAVMTSSPFISVEERRAQMLRALGGAASDELAATTRAADGGATDVASRTFAATMRKTAAVYNAAAAAAKEEAANTRAKRKSAIALPARHDGRNSSLVVCQLNGTCCVGSACFV